MKKALIVVDYQYDFVVGALGFDDALKIETNIVKLIEDFKEQNNNDVIFTYDTHNENYLNSSEGKFLPVPHCVLNTPGHDLYGMVKNHKEDNDKSFNKYTFGSLDLANYLKEQKYDEITLCGVVTNICVISNAILAKSALPEAKIKVIKNACASNDIKMEEYAYKLMTNLNIEVIE